MPQAGDDIDEGYIAVTPENVSVVFGGSFRSSIPTSQIVALTPLRGRVLSIGVHGRDGRWLVNGAGSGIVELTIDPPAEAEINAGPLSGSVELRTLRVSLEDPRRFIDHVQQLTGWRPS